jgi:hypothetical protein
MPIVGEKWKGLVDDPIVFIEDRLIPLEIGDVGPIIDF